MIGVIRLVNCIVLFGIDPGQYSVQRPIGDDRLKYSFGFRRAEKNKQNEGGFLSHKINENQVKNRKFHSISLNKTGERDDLGKPLNDNPGPGRY